jgi:hypothetical protein
MTVIDHAPNRPRKDRPNQFFKMWLCRCECGQTREIESGNLKRNPSCGCKRGEKIAAANSMRHPPRKPKAVKERASHGCAGRGRETPEFRAWSKMHQRCNSPRGSDVTYYAGVKVCERWDGPQGFPNFLADMGKRPSPQHSIDREDGTKGYEPTNCRWATKKEQSQNRRNVIWLTHNGKTQCVADWAAELNLSPQTIRDRQHKGWPIERVLSPDRVPYKGRGQGVKKKRKAVL